MSTYEDRLAALREELKRRRLDGFVVPLTDEHMSEYVGAYAQRLAWLTGFQGSAGSAVVLPAGRGDLRRRALHAAGARAGRRHRALELSVGAADQHRRLAEATNAGGGRADRLRSLAAHQGLGRRRRARRSPNKGAELVAVDTNPVDAVWPDRPLPSDAELVVHAGRCTRRQAPRPRSAPEIGDWLVGAEGGRRGARRARFDRLDVQRPRAGRRPHPRQRSPTRSSTRTAPPICSSPPARSTTTSRSTSATPCASTRATAFATQRSRASGQARRRRSRDARSPRSSRRWKPGGRRR